MLTADDIARVFADGKLVTSPSNNGIWNRAQLYYFKNDTEIIAVEIKNTGGPGGLVASFSNGRVTYNISRILLINGYCFDIFGGKRFGVISSIRQGRLFLQLCYSGVLEKHSHC